MLIDESFVEQVLALAASRRVAVEDERGQVTFGALVDRALRAAAAFGAPLAGRRVALLARQDADWVAVFLGVILGGGVAVPLSPSYPAAELSWFVEDAGAQAAFLDGEHDLPVAHKVHARQLFAGPPAAPVASAAGDTALLLYTSGTTGRPKGAKITHGNMAAQTRLIARAWALGDGDTLLHALPLHHLHGLVVSLLSALTAGARVHMLPRFDVARVVAALPRATVWMAVPTMYHRLREHAGAELARGAAGLRLSTSGSAALPTTLAAFWKDLTGAIPLERYGMTEIGVALSNPLDPAGRLAGHVGFPLPGIDVRVVDGALDVRGPTVFAGYHRRPEATAESLVDGWFKTGDVAAIAASGHYRLLGRTSVDILKSGGEKVSALHIEEALREHPAVADAAVVGLPDEAWGDRIVAAVICRAAVSADELRGFARERLAPHEVPKQIVLVEDLPRNPLGKVMKPDLAQKLAQIVSSR